MSQDPFQALYSGIGGALLLHLTTIESIYPTVCVYRLNRRKTSSLYYMILYFNLWQGAEGSPVVASATEAPHWMIR